jgi:hypothetical protein
MDALRLGRQDSLPATPVKTPSSVDVAVKEVRHSDSEGSTSQQTEALTVTSKKQTITSDVQITRVIETTRTIKDKIICELDDVDEIFFECITLDSYLEFIADERLIHMPYRGSQWDRVLKAAEFFGLQIYTFGEAVSHFVPESRSASLAALAGCRLLLEVSSTSKSIFRKLMRNSSGTTRLKLWSLPSTLSTSSVSWYLRPSRGTSCSTRTTVSKKT